MIWRTALAADRVMGMTARSNRVLWSGFSFSAGKYFLQGARNFAFVCGAGIVCHCRMDMMSARNMAWSLMQPENIQRRWNRDSRGSGGSMVPDCLLGMGFISVVEML